MSRSERVLLPHSSETYEDYLGIMFIIKNSVNNAVAAFLKKVVQSRIAFN